MIGGLILEIFSLSHFHLDTPRTTFELIVFRRGLLRFIGHVRGQAGPEAIQVGGGQLLAAPGLRLPKRFWYVCTYMLIRMRTVRNCNYYSISTYLKEK